MFRRSRAILTEGGFSWLGTRMAFQVVERATLQAERDVRHGRIQRSMAVVTAFAAIISGG